MKRESNIELLRIVAMLLVVFVHANYYSLGAIGIPEIEQSPFNSFIRAFIQQLCVICVNVFVIISGWFGINPSLKGGLSLLFQVFFFHSILVLLAICLGEAISLRTIITGFYFGSIYWFVIAYLVLYFISPVLNIFINKANTRLYLSVLLVFLFMEFVFSLIPNIDPFKSGYSAISFIGLYLLVQFVRKNCPKLQNIGCKTHLLLYLLMSFLPVILFFITKYNFNICAYSSPFVILASLFFFLAFQKMNFYSKAINYIAYSSFSIYLIHMHPIIKPIFIQLMRNAYDYLGGYRYVLFVVAFSICFGIFCVLVDKLRILLWNYIYDTFLKRLIKRFTDFVDGFYSHLGF